MAKTPQYAKNIGVKSGEGIATQGAVRAATPKTKTTTTAAPPQMTQGNDLNAFMQDLMTKKKQKGAMM
jgi:hypothetical protein